MTPEGGGPRKVKIWSRRPNVRPVKGSGILFPRVFPRLFDPPGEKAFSKRTRETGS